MSRKVDLVTETIIDVFPTVFRLDRGRCQNRTSKEHPELRTPEGQLTGWYHLLPGIYNITFNGRISVSSNEAVIVKTSRELVRNGMFLVAQDFLEGYNGAIELTLHVTVAPFEFHRDSILGTLEILPKVQYTGLTGNFISADPSRLAAAQGFVTTPLQGETKLAYTTTGFPIHNNPFLDNVAKFEELDKTLPKVPPVVVPKKTNVLKGKKWCYKEENGVITHKLRITPEQVDEYIANGYIIKFPPNMLREKE